MAMANQETQSAPDLLTLEQVIFRTGWGRTGTYRRARSDELPFPVLKAGARYYVSRVAYEQWLAGDRFIAKAQNPA